MSKFSKFNPFGYEKPEAVAYLNSAHMILEHLKMKKTSPKKVKLVRLIRWYAAMVEFGGTQYDCGAVSEVGCVNQFKRGNPSCRVHWGDERWEDGV